MNSSVALKSNKYPKYAGQNDIKILQWNISSLKVHATQLIANIAKFNYDVIVLQEVRMQKSALYKLKIANYNLFFTYNNVTTNKRGLLTAVHSNIVSKKIKKTYEGNHETLIVEISTKKGLIDIHNYYYSPSKDLDIQLIPRANVPTIFAGDYNAHHPLFSSPDRITRTNDRGNHIESIITNNLNLAILNDKSHWFKYRLNGLSLI